MNKLFFLCLVGMAAVSCSTGQRASDKSVLSAREFVQKITETEDAQVVDVRTQREFRNGHLENALNLDISGSQFRSQISALDKKRPVFVYCLSGVRSATAASTMRKMGYERVYEMPGGMVEWRAEGLPEESGEAAGSRGMTLQQYDELLAADKLVLIDFYADWCAPCKKMKPYLERIARESANKVVLVRIDADENPGLCRTLGVTALPTLRLYRNKVLTWDHIGFIDEAGVREQLAGPY